MVEQKYTPDRDLPYDVDDWFIERIRDLPIECAFDIANQVVKNISILPKKNGWAQLIGGVSHALKEPVFFEIEYLNQYEEKCLLLGVEEIDSDKYLDYIIDKQTLKLNKNDTENNPRESIDKYN